MEIIINSPKHGRHIILIDDADYYLINPYRWYIWKSKVGTFYACHSWKRKNEEVTIKMHRHILGITDPKIKVDHVDTNPLNNKRDNLRIATRSQNAMNRGKTIKNTTGFKGVTFEPKKKLYRVILTAGGVSYSGGRHKNIINAAKKYDELAIKHHGEFANLNFKS